jgi:ABC-type nickel/cobalt efflux system permease component RcnA
MERFFSGATRLLLFVAVVLFFGVTVGLQLVVSGVVPERWQFDNLPRWIQILAGILVVLYVVVEIWFLFHQLRRPKRSKTQNGEGSD